MRRQLMNTVNEISKNSNLLKLWYNDLKISKSSVKGVLNCYVYYNENENTLIHTFLLCQR